MSSLMSSVSFSGLQGVSRRLQKKSENNTASHGVDLEIRTFILGFLSGGKYF